MKKIAWAQAAAAIVLAACTTSTPTEIVVVVTSDYSPGSQLARVVVTTSDETGATISMEDVDIAASPTETAVTLPFSFGVRPAADASRPLRIQVDGLAEGATAPFVTRRVTVPFAIGQRRRLSIFLERACERVACASSEQTCIAGTCVDRALPVSALLPVTPGQELEVDAGTPPSESDGGPPCSADPGCEEAVHVEVGRGFACAVRASGRVACWGEAAALGQLGNGATEPSSVPVEVVGISDAVALALGDDFACIAGDSTVSCWGANDRGQLARGDVPSSATPSVVAGASLATQIFAAASTMCASNGGTLFCWGGALPISGVPLPDVCGGAPCARSPLEEPSLLLLSALADEGHFCLAKDGGAACASENAYGEVGDGTREARSTPTAVPGLATVWGVATNARSSCAIDAVADPESEEPVSTLHCWGADDLGQLGDDGAASERCAGDTPCALSPSVVASVSAPLEVAASDDTSCVRELGGRVLCWGSDADGGIGDGVGSPDRCGDVPCARTPTLARGLVDAVDLDARGGSFCAVRRSGSVVCWGRGYADLPLDVGPFPD